MAEILLPMALDHHIRSRGIDVNDTAAEKLSNLNGDAESKNQSIRVGSVVSCLFIFSLSYYHLRISLRKIHVYADWLKVMILFNN